MDPNRSAASIGCGRLDPVWDTGAQDAETPSRRRGGFGYPDGQSGPRRSAPPGSHN